MSEVKFKVGDLVYCPKFTNKIVRLEHRDDEQDFYTLQFAYDETSTATFANNGIENLGSDLTPIIFHATQEKYELLSKLYPNVEFEPPPKRKEPREIIEAMLDNDYPFVLSSKENYALFLCSKPNINEFNLDDYFIVSKETGKIIIDFVNGEVVLEN